MLSVPGTSTSQAEGIRLLRHHAHDGAGYNAEELFHRSPALNSADGAVGLLHPSVDDRAELGHLEQCGLGNACRGDIALDRCELCLRGVIGVFHAVDASEDLRQIDGFNRNAAGLEEPLRVANGVEGRRARADGANLEILEAFDDAADLREPLEVSFEFRRLYSLGMQRGERVVNAVLHHVVAAAHLAAEAVAADCDRHVFRAIGRGLHQHRHLEA